MIGDLTACPNRGLAPAGKDGRDSHGDQISRCTRRSHRFTALTDVPVSGHRFPAGAIGLAVRWRLRFRLTLATAAELRAERGFHVEASPVHARVGNVAPLDEAATRAFRRLLPAGAGGRRRERSPRGAGRAPGAD